MKKSIIFPVVAGSSIMLSGCATLEMFSFGISGFSYAVTGKSLSDHAISTVMEKDCALHRSLTEDEVCVEYDGEGVLRKRKPGSPEVQVVVRANETYWQDLPVNRQPTNKSGSESGLSQTEIVQTNKSGSESDLAQTNIAPTNQIAQNRPQLKPFDTRQSPDEIVKALMVQNQQTNLNKSGSDPDYEKVRLNKSDSDPGYKKASLNQSDSVLSLDYPCSSRISAAPCSKSLSPESGNVTSAGGIVTAQKISFQQGATGSVEVTTIEPFNKAFKTSVVSIEQPQLFAVLGSYNELHFAKESLGKYPELNAQIINNPARLTNKSATLYRIVAGPFTEAEFVSKVESNHSAWRIALCENSMTPPPCAEQMLAKN